MFIFSFIMTHLFDIKSYYWQLLSPFCSNLANFGSPLFKILKFDIRLLYNIQIKNFTTIIL